MHSIDSIRPLDIIAMKHIGQRTNLIPVIAKADTISPVTLPLFKERIREAIAQNGIIPYTCPIDSDDEDTTKRNIEIMVCSLQAKLLIPLLNSHPCHLHLLAVQLKWCIQMVVKCWDGSTRGV